MTNIIQNIYNIDEELQAEIARDALHHPSFKLISRWIDVSPDEPGPLIERAILLFEIAKSHNFRSKSLNQYVEADLERALSLAPSSKNALLLKVSLLESRDDLDGAVATLKQIIQFSAFDIFLYKRLLKLCLIIGDREGIVDAAETIVELDPKLKFETFRDLVLDLYGTKNQDLMAKYVRIIEAEVENTVAAMRADLETLTNLLQISEKVDEDKAS
jgi:hypothetical protein